MSTMETFIFGDKGKAISQYIEQEQTTEDKTLEGACEALYNAVKVYTEACGGVGRKTKDNAEWKRTIGKYYGISRIHQNRWESVCEKVVAMGLLEIYESEGGRSYWKIAPLQKSDEMPSEDLQEEEISEEVSEEHSETNWDYEASDKPESTGWGGFTHEELEVIEILNVAYLRGHTLYEQGDKPTFYDAHRWALVYDKPLAVRARLRINEHGQSFGYCHNSDGRYTGGLFNCAVMSAHHGGGIMDKEEKELVKQFCMQPCENCPNKRWAKSSK